MKCIRFEQDGKIVVRRTSDELAYQLVTDGRAEYAPKQEWKGDGRQYLDPRYDGGITQ